MTSVTTVVRKPNPPSRGLSINFGPKTRMHLRYLQMYLRNNIRRGSNVDSEVPLQDFSNSVYMMQCLNKQTETGKFANLPEFPANVKA